MNQQITINAMAILSSHEDRLELGEIFRHSKWRLHLSHCLKDGDFCSTKPISALC